MWVPTIQTHALTLGSKLPRAPHSPVLRYAFLIGYFAVDEGTSCFLDETLLELFVEYSAGITNSHLFQFQGEQPAGISSTIYIS